MNRVRVLLEQSGVHERVAAPIDRPLAWAAFVATWSLLGALVGHALVFVNLGDLLGAAILWRPALWVVTLAGYSHWLFLVTCAAFGLAIGLALTTGGFKNATRSELWSLVAVITVGVISPMPLILGGLVAMATVVVVVLIALFALFYLALILGAVTRR